MQIHAWSTKSSSYSYPWAPNSTLYPFLELEAESVPPSLNFPQLDFVHPVTWERVTHYIKAFACLALTPTSLDYKHFTF